MSNSLSEGGRHEDPTGPIPPASSGRVPLPGQQPGARSTRASRGAGPRSHHPDERGRGPALRGCLALVAAALLAGGALVFAISTFGSSFLPHFGGTVGGSGGGDYTGPGTGDVTITVAPGDFGARIGATLEKAGVVKSATTFTALAGKNPEFGALQPGVYQLRKGMSSADALALLVSPAAKVSGGVTIPEGLWVNEIYTRLSKATNVPVADYAKVPSSSLGLPAGAEGKVEGYLFPSTYDFPEGASAATQLKTMVTKFKKEAAALNIPASKIATVTTTASLVQAEASRPQDDGKVARVIQNRLAQKMPLQFDSTVNYILQKRGSVTTSDSARRSGSPYNTYLKAGLTPGPINSPGTKALKAALNPTPGDWLYFVTVDLSTGQTKFATSLPEHESNVREFRAWCSKNTGKC